MYDYLAFPGVLAGAELTIILFPNFEGALGETPPPVRLPNICDIEQVNFNNNIN